VPYLRRLNRGRVFTPAAAFTPPGGGGTGVLTGADLTHLGAFELPLSQTDGSEGFFNHGLTVKETGGVETIMVITSLGNVLEYSIPAAKTSAFNEATLVANWGDIVSPYKVNYADVADPQLILTALHYSRADGYLYWTYRNPYAGSGEAANPFWGRSSLDTDNHVATPEGSWRADSVGWGALSAAIADVPADFAAAYMSGKTVALMGGGIHSIVSLSGDSAGPCLAGIDPSSLPATQASEVANQEVVSFKDAYNSVDYPGPPVRSLRPTGVDAIDSDWENFGWGNSYWLEHDCCYGGAWIRTATKQGVVFLCSFACGYMNYVRSEPACEYIDSRLVVYDEADLAAAILAGTPSAPTPSAVIDLPFQDVNFSTDTPFVYAPTIDISSITRVGDVFTITAPSHGLSDGVYRYKIFGATDPLYNQQIALNGLTEGTGWGARDAYVVDANTIKMRGGGTPAANASGTLGMRIMHANGAGFSPEPFARHALAFSPTTSRIYAAMIPNSAGSKMQINVYQVEA
jgi:hypothetical protein